MSHQDYYKTICRSRQNSHHLPEKNRDRNSPFLPDLQTLYSDLSSQNKAGVFIHTFQLLLLWPFVWGAPLKRNAPGHWPSASARDSRARDECLCGRACCGGGTGSASQCSMSEEGGSRWPYTVPALGGSRGGKKYLNQQDDRYTDGEETIEYEGNT